MSTFRIAMFGAALLGVVVAGTAANAEPVRAAAAFPGVVSVKKIHVSRMVAPSSRESKAKADTTDIIIGAGAGGAAGLGGYLLFRPDRPAPVSP